MGRLVRAYKHFGSRPEEKTLCLEPYNFLRQAQYSEFNTSKSSRK